MLHVDHVLGVLHVDHVLGVLHVVHNYILPCVLHIPVRLTISQSRVYLIHINNSNLF